MRKLTESFGAAALAASLELGCAASGQADGQAQLETPGASADVSADQQASYGSDATSYTEVTATLVSTADAEMPVLVAPAATETRSQISVKLGGSATKNSTAVFNTGTPEEAELRARLDGMGGECEYKTEVKGESVKVSHAAVTDSVAVDADKSLKFDITGGKFDGNRKMVEEALAKCAPEQPEATEAEAK